MWAWKDRAIFWMRDVTCVGEWGIEVQTTKPSPTITREGNTRTFESMPAPRDSRCVCSCLHRFTIPSSQNLRELLFHTSSALP